MVLTDRLSRYTMIFRIKDKSADSVNEKLAELKANMGEKAFYQTFKSLTSDNGLEFSRLQEAHNNTYYATPYTPSERGSNENVIRMIRRYIQTEQLFLHILMIIFSLLKMLSTIIHGNFLVATLQSLFTSVMSFSH